MKKIRNLDHMRVCDISDDGRRIVIRLKQCITTICIDRRGVCKIYHRRVMRK